MNAADSNAALAGTWSLRGRALLTGTLVVIGFMLLAGVALERAYRNSALEASRERLQANVYMLMSAAEFADDGTLMMPGVLADPELSVPDSGTLAAITDSAGGLLWRSESSLVATLVYPRDGVPGEAVFGEAMAAGGTRLYTLSYPLIWELEAGNEVTLFFHAAEDTARVAAAVAAFRQTLQRWLGGAALLLLLLQTLLLTWLLRPLQRVAAEVGEIEAGTREQLAGGYPRELQALTRNLNALLRTSQARTTRYRNALADLAHSLKTPLAVLRNQSAGAAFAEQLGRMDDTISYQLRRAALSGRSPLGGAVDVSASVNAVVGALRKVYSGKDLQITTAVPAGLRFSGDEGDLAELVGNLADNACKWCRSQVRIAAVAATTADGGERLELTVEDDGPGIPASLRDAVTQRGIRADSATPGQGIGLAIVRDIVVEVYGGELQIGASPLGGARVTVRL